MRSYAVPGAPRPAGTRSSRSRPGRLKGGERIEVRHFDGEVVIGVAAALETALLERHVGQRERRLDATARTLRGNHPADRAQRLHADAGAIGARVAIAEVVAVEVVVDAADSFLVEARGALVLEHGYQHVRRAVPGLAAVQVGEVVVHRQAGGNDALLAHRVEFLEFVDQPVAPPPPRRGGAGGARKLAP